MYQLFSEMSRYVDLELPSLRDFVRGDTFHSATVYVARNGF